MNGTEALTHSRISKGLRKNKISESMPTMNGSVDKQGKSYSFFASWKLHRNRHNSHSGREFKDSRRRESASARSARITMQPGKWSLNKRKDSSDSDPSSCTTSGGRSSR